MKKNRFSSFLFWILLMGVIIISASFMLRDTSSERLKYSQVVDLFKGEQVKSFVLDESNQLKMELQDGSTVSYKLRSFEQFYLDLSDTVKEQKESGIITDYDMPAPVDIPWWVSLLPYLIMIGLFIALWIFMMNQANGRGGKIGSFGKSHAKTYDADKKRVTFADVAGADEEKEELQEIVKRSAGILDVAIEPDGAMEIAKRSRGTPRIANRMLRRVRDFAQVVADGVITKDVADKALLALEVDALGLDNVDRRMLRAIIENYGGGPVGLDTLAATIGEESVTLEDVYEPYLMQLGFLTRTPRGRCVTRKAYEHLHMAFTGQEQLEL